MYTFMYACMSMYTCMYACCVYHHLYMYVCMHGCMYHHEVILKRFGRARRRIFKWNRVFIPYNILKTSDSQSLPMVNIAVGSRSENFLILLTNLRFSARRFRVLAVSVRRRGGEVEGRHASFTVLARDGCSQVTERVNIPSFPSAEYTLGGAAEGGY